MTAFSALRPGSTIPIGELYFDTQMAHDEHEIDMVAAITLFNRWEFPIETRGFAGHHNPSAVRINLHLRETLRNSTCLPPRFQGGVSTGLLLLHARLPRPR